MQNNQEAVNLELEEFTAFLINVLLPSSRELFEEQISKMDKADIEKLYRLFKSEKLKTTMAKDGAKLEYIQRLRGICPEGTEMFMSGGCMKCRKKELVSTTIKEKMGGNIKSRFKTGPGDTNSATDAKPNAKQKKMFKHADGGIIRRFAPGGNIGGDRVPYPAFYKGFYKEDTIPLYSSNNLIAALASVQRLMPDLYNLDTPIAKPVASTAVPASYPITGGLSTARFNEPPVRIAEATKSTEQAKSEAKPETQSFAQAFAAARKAGGKEFEWRGKRFTSETKEEATAKRNKANVTPATTRTQPMAAVPVPDKGIVQKAKPRFYPDRSTLEDSRKPIAREWGPAPKVDRSTRNKGV